jgi:hypothetical protein
MFARHKELRERFVQSSRAVTRERLSKRRQYNRLVQTAPILEPFVKLAHVRQDVCSGMTKPIGGNPDDLPPKAVRNIITPLIEKMDDAACHRLEERLNQERLQEEKLKEVRSNRRLEIIQGRKMRERYILALERLSGIHSHSTIRAASTEIPERIKLLAEPREVKQVGLSECLDGLELSHISHPHVVECLH